MNQINLWKAAFLSALFCFQFGNGFSQQTGSRPTRFAFPLSATTVVSQIREDFHPSLQLLEAPAPDGGSEKAVIQALKDSLAARYGSSQAPSTLLGGAGIPWMSDNFRSNNTIDGVPNDNDIAVSDSGIVLSVINSNIWMHDESGTAIVSNLSLDAWSAPLGLTGDKFDPRALYDPTHDRFIVTCLNGFTDSTSWVIVGFSQTSDPTGAWNLYALPGDPRGDSLWTDYPIMALNKGELFLTANLLYNNQPWQTGFQRSLCWQIGLDSAYTGGTLQAQLWDSVYFQGRPIRNLCPVQGGSLPAGPDIFLLSNRNLSTGNDTIWLMHILDSIGGANNSMTIDFVNTNTEYAIPPNAFQQFNLQVATNDARWLDAFIENDNIQFVGNTLDTTTGRPGIYHGIIRDAYTVPVAEGKVIGNPSGSFGYPGITWFGMANGTDEALIGLNYLGPNAQNHPGCGAIFYDGAGNYSALAVAKAGAGYINALSGLDRWGDYMGIQRRYNRPGEAWIAGTWGQSSHMPATWIAEFNHPAIVGNTVSVGGLDVTAFPNPVMDLVGVEFMLPTDQFVEIYLSDLSGRVLKILLQDGVKAGLNRFSFSAESLPAGLYVLHVQAGDSKYVTKLIKR